MKIMYYDGWTKGLHCFIPIDKELKRRGHDTFLVHTGSQKENVSKRETIQGIDCRDVSFYKSSYIHNILKQERPDVLLSLNTTFLWDRANVLSCRKLKIHSVFFMHGETAVGDQIEDFLKNSASRKPVSEVKHSKKTMYLRKVIPNYLFSLFKAFPLKLIDPRTYLTIYSYAKDSQRARLLPVNTTDLVHDRCLVYSKKYIGYYHNKIGYNKEYITVVGKPEYDPFFSRIKTIKKDELETTLLNLLETYKGYVLYIENGYPEANYQGWDDKFRNDQLDVIAKQLLSKNLLLVIKTHPHTIEKSIQTSSSNIFITKNKDVFSLVYYCEYAIGHSSTLNDLPILLDKPLVIPAWGPSLNIPKYYEKDSNVVSYWNNSEDKIVSFVDIKARNLYKDEKMVLYKEGMTARKKIVNILEDIVLS